MRVLARSFWVGLIISSCLATVGGCSSNDEEPAHTDPNADPLAVALERDTGVVWNVTRDDHGRPSIVIPADKPRPLSKITQPSEVALEVFHRYAKLFGVTSDDAPIVTEVTDGPGEVQTVVLEQKVAGLRILHSGASVHVYPDGSLAWIEPTFHSNLKSVSTTPSLSTDDAKKKALDAVQGGEHVESIELCVYPTREDALVLAYEMYVSRGESLKTRIVVDAATGGVLDRSSDELLQLDATAFRVTHYQPIPFTDDTLVTFPVTATPEGWAMSELVIAGKAGGIRVHHTDLDASDEAPRGPLVTGSPFSSAWDVLPYESLGSGAAVDAFVNARIVAGWYEKEFRARGYHGGGRIESIDIYVHHMANERLGYSPNRHAIVMSDWHRGLYLPGAHSLDVVAHEYTHAVQYRHLGLREPANTERRGLSEALADIFATFISHELHPGPGDTLHGEDVTAPGWRAIRDLIEPDSTDVLSPQIVVWERGIESRTTLTPHAKAGIPTKAWSMMTMGGDAAGVHVARGIGWSKSLNLWFQTLLQRERTVEPNFDNFDVVAARQIAQANALHWSKDEVEAVACGWMAVRAISEASATNLLHRRPTCVVDRKVEPPKASSCVGRESGYVCNSQVPFSASKCNHGRYERTYVCDTDEVCQHPEGDFTATLTDAGVPVCVPAKSR